MARKGKRGRGCEVYRSRLRASGRGPGLWLLGAMIGCGGLLPRPVPPHPPPHPPPPLPPVPAPPTCSLHSVHFSTDHDEVEESKCGMPLKPGAAALHLHSPFTTSEFVPVLQVFSAASVQALATQTPVVEV